MKTYILFRILWIPVLSGVIYVTPYLKAGLNWLCSNPTLWTPQLGYAPALALIVVGLVNMHRLIGRDHQQS